MNKKTFEILAENCKQLECLILGDNIVNLRWPYELICQLPRLRHLQVHYKKGLRHELIEGFVNKKDSHLESLILKGCELSLHQVQHICKISTLKELHVPSKIVPLADLQKLTNLLYLHITMPDMGPNQDLDLKKALSRVQASVTEQKERRGLAYSYVNIPPTLMN
ncbi:uncharacterized protein DMAD_12572 [Drosophila madeirensis]|uniref:Uncharacterized protein n=1 Tax=Drosophila madeirensis TaxID=30013 RepID=A0AAU9FHH3_DROMD